MVSFLLHKLGMSKGIFLLLSVLESVQRLTTQTHSVRPNMTLECISKQSATSDNDHVTTDQMNSSSSVTIVPPGKYITEFLYY
jgi:Ca2+-dependent lipid-binding protein